MGDDIRGQPINDPEDSIPEHLVVQDSDKGDYGGEDWHVKDSVDGIRVVVVGNLEGHAKNLVEVLADGSDWKEWRTMAGLRVLTRIESSPGRVLLNTTPLQHVFDKSVTAVAKRWISENSLRRVIVGKPMIVICVIPYSALEDPCYSNMADHTHCWVDALRLIFRDYKRGVMFLVNNCPVHVSKYRKAIIKAFVKCHQFDARNIIFCRYDDDVKTVVEQSITLGDASKTFSGQLMGRLSAGLKSGLRVNPFFINETQSSRRKYGIWGPDRIILFGRTGSGKSTLAQMLTRGKLDPSSDVFVCGSGIRGCTTGIEQGEGRGWYVVDMPGFGEPNGPESTVSTDRVCQMVKEFIKVKEGTFTHYLYVMQKDRIDGLEESLWKFFKMLFGDDLGSHFSIIISQADNGWIAENQRILDQRFDGCRSFLGADFPPSEVDQHGTIVNRELDAETQAYRTSSLQELEEQLDRLRRCDRPCYYGKNSSMTKVIERDRCHMDSKIDQSLVIKTMVRVSETYSGIDNLLIWLAHVLTAKMDKVALTPLELQ